MYVESLMIIACLKIWQYLLPLKLHLKTISFWQNLDQCRINSYHAEFLKWNNSPSVLQPSIIIFRDIKLKTWSWSANSIEPGQTAKICRLAWLYTGGKLRLMTFGVGRIRVNHLTMLPLKIIFAISGIHYFLAFISEDRI